MIVNSPPTCAKISGHQLIEGDFLDAKIGELSPGVERIAVLSNLPYHLSSPILFRLIEHKERFVRLVLTFQKEFADRLIALPRTSEYSSLSIQAQLHFKIEKHRYFAQRGLLPGADHFVRSPFARAQGAYPRRGRAPGRRRQSGFRPPAKESGERSERDVPGAPSKRCWSSSEWAR